MVHKFTSDLQPPLVPAQSKGRKRIQSIEHALEASPDLNPDLKRQCISPLRPTPSLLTEYALGEPAISSNAYKHTNPVAFYGKEDCWSEEQDWLEETSRTDSTMDSIPLARKKSTSNLSRKRLNSATSMTLNGQKPKMEKSALYRDQRYKTLLEVKGSYMTKASLGLASASQALYWFLLEKTPPVPAI